MVNIYDYSSQTNNIGNNAKVFENFVSNIVIADMINKHIVAVTNKPVFSHFTALIFYEKLCTFCYLIRCLNEFLNSIK